MTKTLKAPFSSESELDKLQKKVIFDSELAKNQYIKDPFRGKITLYNQANIEECPWPQNMEGRYAEKFLTPLIKGGVSAFIENVQTDLQVLVWDQLVLPITINELEYENSYVCSPYSYYISYAKQSLSLLTQTWAYHAINTLLWGVAKVLRQFQVNKVVVVNNWFFSTNLFPSINASQLEKIGQFLKNQFPEHAIVFRSIDPHTNPNCFQTLDKIGFDYIASREIFFIDPHKSSLFESRLYKSDLKLLANSGYDIINNDQLTDSDIPHLLSLYQSLFINKYSDLNPKFNTDFLKHVLREKVIHFKALKKEGKIDGIVGYVERNGMMFCPIFGYDREVPKEVALYRLLSTVLMNEAYDKKLLFHQSSGASMFKKIRKAHSCIEYMAVYTQHLKINRRIPWKLLKRLCNSLGIIYMKRY